MGGGGGGGGEGKHGYVLTNQIARFDQLTTSHTIKLNTPLSYGLIKGWCHLKTSEVS